MFIQNWGDTIFSSLESLWMGFIGFLPGFLSAFIVFIIGLIIAVGVAKLAKRLVSALRVDSVLDKMGFKAPMERAGMKLDFSHFMGELVKWFLIIVFLVAAFDILGLDKITEFLNSVLLYIPNVIVAVFILLIAIVVANFLEKMVKAAVLAGKLTNAGFLATVTKWAVLIFAIFAALMQLGIAPALISTLFTGFVAMIAIAGGIAFGTGGKDYAGELIKRLEKSISKD